MNAFSFTHNQFKYQFYTYIKQLHRTRIYFSQFIFFVRLYFSVMAATTNNEAKVSIKVIVDKVNKRVVYAEADYTFVDILFSFMTLPLGTIVRLLGKLDDKKFEAMGSLNNLYQSLKDFPECYLSSEECKSMLLNPRSLLYEECRKLKVKIDDTEPVKYFRCASCFKYSQVYSTCNKAKCRICNKLMDQEFSTSNYNDCFGGAVFVSDIVTFIVTEDLCVMPYSSANSIRLLTKVGITNTSSLEDIKLDMDCKQMLYFLEMSLSLDSPLTYLVFNRTGSIWKMDVPCQGSTLDQTNSLKKEESSSSKIFLEVSLQRSTGKLLFAEAKNDFVEFVFGFLSIPLGTVIGELSSGASSFRCMDNIFKSISNMSVGSCLKSQYLKDLLLTPHTGLLHSSKYQLFSLKCTPSCRALNDPRIDEKFLKQSGMFIVTDDLIISPSSSFSTMNTLNNLKVPFNDVEKFEISIGFKEGLSMFKASSRCSSTLTDSLHHLLKK
ncbi:hypothetical protein HanLR1_Chr09g0301031 [Helianthus annuus]|nr:hypothetical protein HanLR1_Chr09g0301031 [Helianthus annuus]